MLERSVEYRKMLEVEASHWWYRALHRRVLASIEARFGTRRELAILDVACGTGGLLTALRGAGYKALKGVDLSPHAVAATGERGFDVLEADLRDVPEKLAGQSFDVIVMNDVNYFVPLADWPGILERYGTILKPGGMLAMNTPALAAFRGMHDLAVGIGYRMRRRDVAAMLPRQTFALDSTRYWPLLVSPLIFGVRLVQRVQMALKPKAEIHSDVEMPSAPMNAAFGALMRLEEALPKAPWGSSLFIVLRRV